MQYSAQFEQLISFTANGDKKAIRHLFTEQHVVDFAETVNEFGPEDCLQLMHLLRLPQQAELFGYLEPDLQAETATLMSRNDLAALFSSMEADERADLFNRLSQDQQQQLLPGLAHAEREDIRRLASYPENTAGAMMTSDYASLYSDWTVREALTRLRLEAPDKETIYLTYVLNTDRRLLGTLSLKELILANPSRRIDQLMKTDLLTIQLDESQENVAYMIRHYDLLALPVVDPDGRMVGIVTYDDAMDAAVAEATEDAQKSASVAALDAPLNKASFTELYRKRIGWLVLLVFGALLSGAGISYFEDTIAAQVALVFFMPLLVGSGGNAGSQSAALMVRALATGEFQLKDWRRVLRREVGVAGALGITMGATVYGLGLFRGGPEIAIVVAVAMTCVVVVGSLIGLCLPILLSRVNLDPATASGPLVTTIVDATGVIIYFGFASWLLGV